MHEATSEAQTATAHLRDVRPDDFIRFCEYAYRGDYTVPDCVRESAHVLGNTIESSTTVPLNSSQSVSTTSARPILRRDLPWKDAVRQRLESKEFPNYNWLKTAIQDNCDPQKKSSDLGVWMDVLIPHIRLYCFANTQLVAGLKDLVLHKLHSILVDDKKYPRGYEEITELARYVYCDDNTPARKRDAVGTADPLRLLVVEYLVSNIEYRKSPFGFTKFMAGDKEFTRDFWKTIKASFRDEL
jgi:hypothetical protein